MGLARFRHEGKAVDYTPEADVAAGDVVDLSTGMQGIANVAIAAGEVGALQIEGVYEVPADTQAGDQGAPCSLSAGASTTVTVEAGPHSLAKAVAETDTKAWVKLNNRLLQEIPD